ncbi:MULTISPECIES: caspase family protein [Sphingomonas]|uniref:caspase family protein n=1 Tax=Sphingomonas TaxID=13687 RepID=UPI00082B3220|nr:caspase family protein [Sphingomonas sp. CCH10-B3]
MKLRTFFLWLAIGIGVIGSLPARAQSSATGPRIALVVGNANYGASFGALTNPVNDAKLIGDTLRSLGFDVEVVTDTDQRTLKQAIVRFGQRLGRAGSQATGLFYYAGHGVQSRGNNYLIPVGAAIAKEADLDIDGVDANAVLSQMQEAGIATSIVVLDACRNMPLVRSFRSGTRGLARMEAPNGSYIAYSTRPGQTAADGNGVNSPFAKAFVDQVQRPGQSINEVFDNVRLTVSEVTQGQQIPASDSTLLRGFVFKAGGAAAVAPAPMTASTIGTATTGGSEADRLVAECDRLAGDPGDPGLPVGAKGIRLDSEILPALAVPACKAAVAAAPGSIRSSFNLGRALTSAADYAEAKRLFEQAAATGYSSGESYLGYLYFEGWGVAQDYGRARTLFEQAATHGNGDAMAILSLIYSSGLGVAQDYAQARLWAEQGAAKGSPTALSLLGDLHFDGKGAPRDPDKARALYEQAAALGDPRGMAGAGALYYSGFGVAKNYTLARSWLEKAAAKNQPTAIYLLGTMYENGLDVPQDYARARLLYEQAIAKGDPSAISQLGWLYLNGFGVPKDVAKAKEYFERADAKGVLAGTANLGWLYYNGWGVPKDYVRARQLFERAAAGGVASAMNNLGLIYQLGYGVPKDRAKAREWYTKAANLGLEMAKSNLAKLGAN